MPSDAVPSEHSLARNVEPSNSFPRDVLLRYRSQRVESAFWSFNTPQIGTASTLTVALNVAMCAFLAFVDVGWGDEVYRFAIGTAFFVNLLALIVHVLFVVLGFVKVVGSAVVVRATQVCVTAVLVASSSFAQLGAYALETASRGGADCRDPALVNDSRRVYDEKNCFHYLEGWLAVLATLGVLLQLPIIDVVIMNSCIVVLGVVTAILYWETATVARIQVPYAAAVDVFTVFVRYLREREERAHFELHLQLDAEIESIKQRRSELQDLCRQVLPPIILARTAAPGGETMIDVAPTAAVLCISMHNFSQFCNQNTPLAVAEAVDRQQAQLWRLAEACDLQSISTLQDQVVIVGNLLKPLSVEKAVFQCCNVGLQVTTADTGSRPPMHAAVHLGPVAGGFVGKEWMRYDVLGEGVATCKAALLAAEPATVLVTDDAVHECREHLRTREAGSIGFDDDLGGSFGPGRQESSFVGVSKTGLHLLESVALSAPGSMSVSAVDGMNPLVPQRQRKDAPHRGNGELSTEFQRLKDANTILQSHVIEEGNTESVRLQWCLFERFCDDHLEEQFLDYRVVHGASHSSRTLFAFACFVLFLFVVLLVHFEGPGATPAALMLIVGALLSALAAAFPLAVHRSVFLRYHLPWSLGTLVLPLWALFATAIARPSLVGNDLKAILILGTFVRSTCFRETKYQLLAKPLMLALAQFQLFLPGAKMRIMALVAYFLVLYTVVIDRDVDRAERRRYVAELKLLRVRDVLASEARVREGVLASTMPPQVLKVPHFLLYSGHCESVPDTAVLVVAGNAPVGGETDSPKCSKSDSAIALIRAASEQLIVIEEVLKSYPTLTLVKAMADVVIVVSPVKQPGALHFMAEEEADAMIREATDAAVHLSCEGRGALLDIDSTLQVVSMRGAPSFNVFGPGMTRMLSIIAAMDRSALQGALVTERVLSRVAAIRDSSADSYEESPLGPMGLRGVGVIRLTRLSHRN